MTGRFHAVVPAGGSGTRLWPLSRAANPKFLHALAGTERSLLQSTVDRLAPLAPPERTFVVTGTSHAVSVARQVPSLPEGNILVEPAPRDSAPAIGLAAAVIARRDPDAVMGSFAADHRVADPDAFVTAVRLAAETAEDGYLVTIGLTPTHAETGYGYIHEGEALRDGVFGVREFKEKPPRELAESYVESGEYLWNASMFVWRAATMLDELAHQMPELHAGLIEIAESWDTPRRDEVLGAVWPTLPKIAVDYAVMEGAAARGRVATVPAAIGWNDIGDWHTLGEILPSDEFENTIIGTGDVRLADTSRAVVVPQGGRSVSVLGMKDVIVVDTPDAVLVCPRDRAQDVKSLVDGLEAGHPLR